MNKTIIEWANYTVNPLIFSTVLEENRGCAHRCPYCYVQKFSQHYRKNFTPGFYPERIKGTMKDSTIFVESIGDLFHPLVTSDKIQIVLEACAKLDTSNTIVFLTKNPERYAEFLSLMQSNFVLGFTMETDSYPNPDFNHNVKWPHTRAEDFIRLKWTGLSLLSYEPAMKANNKIVLEYFKLIKPTWIAFGANSVKSIKLEEPTIAEIYELTLYARRYCKSIIFKENFARFEINPDYFKIRWQSAMFPHKSKKVKHLEDYFK